LTGTLTRLAIFRTRHSLTAEFPVAADWMKSELEARGFAVSKRPISVGTGAIFSVVADGPGAGVNRRLVIVMAYLNSVNTAGGVTAAAPGADGNGSGAAGLLEIGRVLETQSSERGLRLILFGGEEQGLHGSQQYVGSLGPADRSRIDSVINMDIIATLNTPALTVLLEGATVSLSPDAAFYVQVGVPYAGNASVYGQPVRAGGVALTATVTSSDATVARLTTTGGSGQSREVTIAVGQFQSPSTVATGGVALDPLTSGSTVVAASIPGFIATAAATVNVTVSP